MSLLRHPLARLWLATGASLLLAALAFRNVQLGDLLAALARIDPAYLAVAVGLYFVDLWLRALRWRWLIGGAKRVGVGALYVGLVIGYAANNLLPARAGEIARSVAAGRLSGARPAGLLGTVVVERVLDGLTIVLLLVLLVPLLPAAEWVRPAVVAGGGVFGVLTVGLVVVARTRGLATRLLALALARLPYAVRERALTVAGAGLDGVAGSLSPRAGVLTLLLSVTIWLVGASIYLAVGAALGVSLPVWWWLIAICLVNLATSLPLAPAGAGAFELVLIEVLTLATVPVPAAASLTLVLHAVLVVPVVLAGLACVWTWGLRLNPAPLPAGPPPAHPSPAVSE
jgi:uncharacterized protein (TIRG00374 family)